MQRQFEHAGPARIDPAGADDEFTNAMCRVRVASRILWIEPGIVMYMSVQYNTRMHSIQSLPQGAHSGSAAPAGGKERMVPVGEYAGSRIGRQVRAQPLLLWRSCLAADKLTITVEHDNVPCPEVVAVIALVRVSGGGAKIIEVALGARRIILVVTGRGACARQVTTPRGIVAISVFGIRAVRVNRIAEGRNRPRDSVEQGGSILIRANAATGDITRGD